MARNTKESRVASIRRSVGGASNELGAHFRATVAAWVAAHGLVGRPLPPCIPPASSTGIPWTIYLETTDELDDIRVVFTGGARLQIQAKHSVTLAPASIPMQAAIKQWTMALSNTALDISTTRLVLATANPSRSVRALGSALARMKEDHPGAFTGSENDALSGFKKMMNVTDEQFATLSKVASIVDLLSVSSVAGIEHVSIELLDGRVVVPGEGSRAWSVLVDHARELARRRAGDSIHGWIEVLRRRNVALVADAQASIAGRLEAERLAAVKLNPPCE
jgi:hypothetical protein